MSTETRPLVDKISRLEAQIERMQSHLDSESMTRIDVELALGSAEEQLGLALDAARLATWQWDLQHRRISFNPRWNEIIQGPSMPIVQGDDEWMAGIHPDDKAQLQDTLLQVAKRKRTRFLAQFRYLALPHKDQIWVWVEMVGVLKGSSSSGNKMIVGCASDITVRKVHLDEIKAARTKAERANQTKNEFLAHVSHELRTPLHAVLGMVELLEAPSDARLTHTQTEHLGVLKQSAEHVLTLVNDLLDFSSFERAQNAGSAEPFQAFYEPVELNAWMKGVCEPFKHRAVRLGFSFQLNRQLPTPCTLKLELRRTTQVINNLITNAFKFTQSGCVTVDVRLEGDRLIFTVQDTGIGIAAEQINGIFKAFTQADSGIQRQYGGTGLGLAISQRICHHLGGDIAVTSVLGQGSTFTVNLPAEPAGATTLKDLAHPHVDTLNPALNILVVDDTPVNLRVVNAYLKQFKLSATLCESAALGLESMQAHTFDVVIVDLQMPGMSGFEMLNTAKNTLSPAQTSGVWIASTAHATEGYEQQCLDAGFDRFLSKPFSAAQLFTLLLDAQTRTGSASPRPARPIQPNNPSAAHTASPSPAPAAAMTSRFDVQAFSHRFGADTQLMRDIALALHEDAEMRVMSLRKAYIQGDHTEMRRQTHALKGAFGQLGDTQVPQRCLAIENNLAQCTASDIEQLAAVIAHIVTTIDQRSNAV